MGTLKQIKEDIIKRLEDSNKYKSTIVITGDTGMGKTWMARKISERTIDGVSCYETLWVYMTENYDLSLFYKDIARQYLSLSPITEEWKNEEEKSEEEKETALNKINIKLIKLGSEEEKADHQEEMTESLKIKRLHEKLREIGRALFIKNKHLLLVLDDVGNNLVHDNLHVTLPKRWRSMFPSKFRDRLKIIVTTRKLGDCNAKQDSEVIEFPPHLQKQELSDLLHKSVNDKVSVHQTFQQFGEAIAEKSEGKEKREGKPTAIIVIAKALNYTAQHDPSKLESAILKAAYCKNTFQGVNPLVYCACDMIKSSVTKNCFWLSLHLFRSYGGLHYNELITHWIMEGYFNSFDHVEEAYHKGHDVLMELIDRALLKFQENNIVAVEGATLNMIDSCLLRYRCTATLRLFRVLKYEESLGKITRMNGMIKTLCNPKSWKENSTLLIDSSHLSQEHQTFFNLMEELKVLAVFSARCKSLMSFLSKMDKLLVLVLRRCDLLDDIAYINKLKTLKVLEISVDDDSYLTSLPENLLDGLTHLQSLNLSGLQMKSLSSLSNLCELHSLILKQFTRLEEVQSLRELVKLEILDLSGASSLKLMPSNLFDEITNLQSLNLSGLQLIESLPSFSKLSELRVLILSRCSSLVKLESLQGLGKLQILDISDATSFERFDDSTLSVLPKIEMIDLSYTKIQTLPEFDELTELTQIFLSGCCNVCNIPTLQHLTSLQILDLSGAVMFETFTDESIVDLDQLRVLDLSKTSISKLPSIPRNLLELNLRGCSKLEQLPPTIYQENIRIVNEGWTPTRQRH